MSHPYEVVIGLEIHVQCNTKSKMFCSCSNDSFGREPNVNTCYVCMGFPGALPVLNHSAFEKGVLTGLALGCSIANVSKFDRKNYFYPDLPKAYQISQFFEPVAVNGAIEIELQTEVDEHGNLSGAPVYKNVGIERLHLEEDAGKLTHTSTGTLCDYNRSGSPLMEIVSKPDMRSIPEASAYAREVQRIVRHVGSSDADMEKGMMRFDINVSLREFGAPLGTKVEIKNVNSFRSLERALDYEIKRQSALLLEGKGAQIVQETRGWDDERGTTESQRGKEGASDYRYFPEPDLPPSVSEIEFVEHLRSLLPELPVSRKKRYVNDLGLSIEYATLLVDDAALSDFFNSAAKKVNDDKEILKAVANLLVNVVVFCMEKGHCSVSQSKLTVDHVLHLIELQSNGEISSSTMKEVVEILFFEGGEPSTIVDSRGLRQVNDSAFLEGLCDTVVSANPDVVVQIKSGKDKAIGFLVGQVMKQSVGKANPVTITKALLKKIAEI